jgi:hypothetical protein
MDAEEFQLKGFCPQKYVQLTKSAAPMITMYADANPEMSYDDVWLAPKWAFVERNFRRNYCPGISLGN